MIMAHRRHKQRRTTKRRIKKSVRAAARTQKTHIGGSRYEYVLNPDFEFFSELKAIMLKASSSEKEQLTRTISKLGRIKLAVISGVFLDSQNANVELNNAMADLLIVGEDISKKKLSAFLKQLEADVGSEIRFGIMDKEEFDYRYTMFDRFVRMLLEGPHEKIINRIGI